MVVFTMVDYWKYSRGFPMKNTLNDAKEKYQKDSACQVILNLNTHQ